MLQSLLTADAVLRAWVTMAHVPWLDHAMWTASLIGQAGEIWLLIAVAATFARPAVAARLWQLVLVILLCYVTVDAVLKPIIGRARPFEALTDVRVVGVRPVTRSFPSGHSASAFGGAFVVALMLPRARRWLWALAGLIALSRVYIGVHYPLDVIGGALVGLAVAVVVTGQTAWYSQGSLAARAGDA